MEAGGVGSVRSKPGGRQTAGQILLRSKQEMMVAWTRKWQWGEKRNEGFGGVGEKTDEYWHRQLKCVTLRKKQVGA